LGLGATDQPGGSMVVVVALRVDVEAAGAMPAAAGTATTASAGEGCCLTEHPHQTGRLLLLDGMVQS
jgi:hypothetical protein